jgi:hypothetical protein
MRFVYLGTLSPSSALKAAQARQRCKKKAELVLTIPFGIDMLQAFAVPWPVSMKWARPKHELRLVASAQDGRCFRPSTRFHETRTTKA